MLERGWSEKKLLRALESQFVPARVLEASTVVKSPRNIPLASPSTLVIVPTRELAIQVANECKLFRSVQGCLVLVALVVGGHERKEQLDLLRKGPQILVATPGRLTELLVDGHVSLQRTSILVLDEADKMLAMGFEEQLEQINAAVAPTRQVNEMHAMTIRFILIDSSFFFS